MLTKIYDYLEQEICIYIVNCNHESVKIHKSAYIVGSVSQLDNDQYIFFNFNQVLNYLYYYSS